MVPHGRGRDSPESASVPRIIHAMLLALDIGNTNVTTGLFRAGALVATRRAATNQRATTDELELLLDGLLRLDGFGLGDLDAIAMASVVPALADGVEAIAARHDLALVVAGPGTTEQQAIAATSPNAASSSRSSASTRCSSSSAVARGWVAARRVAVSAPFRNRPVVTFVLPMSTASSIRR